MQDSSIDCFEDHDCMIHAKLNDMAVSMLENNCYHQSFDTFKEANQTVKRDFNESGGSWALSSGSIANTCSDLDMASRRMEAPEPFPKAPAIKYSTSSIQDLTSTGDKAVDFVFEQLQQGEGLDESILLIRFAEHNVSKKMAAAIIKYNLGLAHQAYAKALQDKGRLSAARVQTNLAVKFVKSSESTMEKLSSKSTALVAVTGKKGSYQTLLLLLATRLALHKLVLGTPEEGKVSEDLSCLYSEVMSMFEALKVTPENAVNRFYQSPRGKKSRKVPRENCSLARSA
jgi:hypothetical protein